MTNPNRRKPVLYAHPSLMVEDINHPSFIDHYLTHCLVMIKNLSVGCDGLSAKSLIVLHRNEVTL